jgi:hypothetical protein
MNRRIIFGFLLTGCLFLFVPDTANAQVVVKEKPTSPKVIIVKPDRPGQDHVWIDGHWKWNKKLRKYVWIRGGWVKARRGHVWVPGKWQELPDGWKWIPGRWSTRNIKKR